MMRTTTSALERTGFVLIALSLGAVQFSLFVGQSLLFSAAALVWLTVALRDRRWPETPAFFRPLLVYAGLTLVSAACSPQPGAGFWDSRQLLMFLMVPIVARFARGEHAVRAIDIILAIGSAGALLGIVQFAMFGYDDLSHRPVGTLGHWMTYSGLLMLATCAAVARLAFGRSLRAWPTIALPAFLIALVVTNTRNAWIGAFLAAAVILAIRNWKLVLIVPLLAGLAFVIAPGTVRQRANSLLHPTDPASRDRVVMLQIGRDMIGDHPLVGLGPHMIESAYARYREKYPDAVNPTNPHLHNVPVQIAAERGLPALAAWLWFVVVAARDLWRQLRAGAAPAVAAVGLAALVAMLAAGLFEYNFGDSEFLMMLLGLLTLPWAAARPLASPSPEAARA